MSNDICCRVLFSSVCVDDIQCVFDGYLAIRDGIQHRTNKINVFSEVHAASSSEKPSNHEEILSAQHNTLVTIT